MPCVSSSLRFACALHRQPVPQLAHRFVKEACSVLCSLSTASVQQLLQQMECGSRRLRRFAGVVTRDTLFATGSARHTRMRPMALLSIEPRKCSASYEAAI